MFWVCLLLLCPVPSIPHDWCQKKKSLKNLWFLGQIWLKNVWVRKGYDFQPSLSWFKWDWEFIVPRAFYLMYVAWVEDCAQRVNMYYSSVDSVTLQKITQRDCLTLVVLFCSIIKLFQLPGYGLHFVIANMGSRFRSGSALPYINPALVERCSVVW